MDVVVFVKADPHIRRAPSGTGLGLTIAKQLAEAHGGEIVVSSKVLDRPLQDEFVLGANFFLSCI